LIRSQGVVVVHTFFETSDLWSSVVAKMSGCPILISSRRDMGILRSAKHQLTYRLINSLFDRVLTVSEEVRSFCIEREGLEPGKVVTLYNGLELEQVSASNGMESLRDSLGLQCASHLVTTVAHVRRVKGLDTLIQAG